MLVLLGEILQQREARGGDEGEEGKAEKEELEQEEARQNLKDWQKTT